MSEQHLAQLNIARLKFTLEQAEMADFVARLEEINALADQSPGFVWRLQTDDGDATAIDFFGPDYLVNMSVWTSCETLHDYVYRSEHKRVMAARKQWFERIKPAYAVLWWIPRGTLPTLDEAADRLDCLRQNGPSARAFTFKHLFPPG